MEGRYDQELRSGGATDAAFLAEAFRYANAVYTLLPTDRHATDYRAARDQQGAAIVKAPSEGRKMTQ